MFKHIEVPILLISSVVTLVMGLSMPVLTVKKMFFWKNTFSVLSGIEALWHENYQVLAAIVFLFSVVFPIVKLILMFLLWLHKLGSRHEEQIAHWVSYMGKWSMLDVFVVALTIVIVRVSGFTEAKAEDGIYVFAISIALAIIASMRLEQLSRKS